MSSPDLRFVLTLTLALTASACGGKVVVDGAPGASSASQSGGTGGTASESTSSSVVASGSGGAGVGGCSGGDGAPPPPLSCGATDQAILSGTLDGQPFSLSSEFGDLTRAEAAYLQGIGTSGHAFFTGDSKFAVSDGTIHAARAWVQMPAGAPHAQSWFCDAAGSNVAFAMPTSDSVLASATLADLRALGPCPGLPVSGQLDYCILDGSDTCSPGQYQGTIDGAAVTSPSLESGSGSPWPGAQEIIYDGGGLVLLQGTEGAPGGVLIEPGCGPHVGALYCIGKITPGGPGKLVLRDLSRLGTCAEAPAAPGTLSLCASLL